MTHLTGQKNANGLYLWYGSKRKLSFEERLMNLMCVAPPEVPEEEKEDEEEIDF